MAASPKAIRKKNKLFIAAYGEERLDVRNDSVMFRGDLRDTYVELPDPSVLMHVLG